MPTGAASTRSPLVLVADDDDDLRASLADLLNTDGYQVVVARDGREAVSVIAEAHPDLIILDLVMPVMNGWEVLEQLEAEHLVAADQPIILFSGSDNADPETSFGNVVVLTKGGEPEKLLAIVGERLARAPQGG